MKVFALTIFISFQLLVLNVHSQGLIFKNYLPESGLPSLECYQVVEDFKGYVWVATDNGLARFNGKEFKVFQSSTGSNTFIRICPFGEGIIASRLDRKLVYCDGKSISQPKFIQTANNILDHESTSVASLYYSDSNTLCITTVNYISDTARIVYVNKSTLEVTIEKFTDTARVAFIHGLSNYSINIVGLHNNSFRIQNRNGKQKTFNLKESEGLMHKGMNLIDLDSSRQFLTSQDQAYLIENGQIMDSLIHSMFLGNAAIKINHETVLIGVRDKPMISIKISGNKFVGITEHKEIQQVSNFFIDFENSLWITTLNDGLIQIPCFECRIINKTKGNTPINSVCAISNNHVYSALKNGQLYSHKVWNLDSIESTLIQDLNQDIFEIKEFDNTLWVNTISTIVERPIKIMSQSFMFVNNGGGKLFKLAKDSIWLTGSHNVDVFVKQKDIYKRQTFSNLFRVNSVADFQGKKLFATLKGIRQFRNYEAHKINIDDQLDKDQINDLKTWRGQLLIASASKGLAIWNGKKIKFVNKKSGLVSNNCKRIYVEDSGTIWVITGKGINRITVDGKSMKIELISKENGLISNDINDMSINGGFLWAATDKGESFAPISYITAEKAKPKIHFENFKISDSILVHDNNPIFKRNQNTISLNYSGISGLSGKELVYKFEVRQDDELISSTQSKHASISFANLGFGTYSISANAINQFGIYSDQPALVTFTILPAFYETYWFKFIVLLGIIGVIYLLFLVRYKQIKRNLALKNSLLFQKQRALNAQMNPHFIFNAMGSIQNLVIKNKNDLAEDYLTKFANLTRSILNDSSVLDIELNEEIRRVGEYVDIENLRFNNRIGFKVNIENSIQELNPKIPTMLFQTLIENAIIHGILPNNHGNVEVKVDKLKDKLLVEISDDGIGINKSRKLAAERKNKRQSKGVSIVEERLRQYQQLHKTEYSIEFIDKSDINDQLSGTIVRLLVPFQKHG